MPLVSVLCVTYNHAKFIRDALESFLTQETTFPVEIVVHDDASSDGTAKLLRQCEHDYPQIFRNVYQSRNLGRQLPRASDFAAQYCRGQFIALCEGDDCWIAKDKLQKQVLLLNQNPDVSLVFHNAWVKHAKSADDRFMNSGLKEGRLALADVISRKWFAATSSVVMRKSVMTPPDTLKFCHSQDVVLQLTAALRGELYYIDEVMSVYRQHAGGISEAYRSRTEALYDDLYPNLIWMNWGWYCECCPESHLTVAATRIRHLMKMVMAHEAESTARSAAFSRTALVSALRASLERRNPGNFPESCAGKPETLSSLIDDAADQVLRDCCYADIDYYGRTGEPVECLKSFWRFRPSLPGPTKGLLKHAGLNFVRSVLKRCGSTSSGGSIKENVAGAGQA